MAIEKKVTIQAYLADGDEPTGAQFENVIDSLRHQWQDHAFAGEAAPGDTPVTDRQVFYVAKTAGTYTAFDGITVASGEVAYLKYDIDQDDLPSSVWTKVTIMTGGNYSRIYTATFTDADLDADGTLHITFSSETILRPLFGIVTMAGSDKETMQYMATPDGGTGAECWFKGMGKIGPGTHTIDIFFAQ